MMSEGDRTWLEGKFNGVYHEIKSVRLELTKPIQENKVNLAEVKICAKTAKTKIENYITGHKGSLGRTLTIISLTVGIVVGIIVIINYFN